MEERVPLAPAPAAHVINIRRVPAGGTCQSGATWPEGGSLEAQKGQAAHSGHQNIKRTKTPDSTEDAI